MNTLLKTMKELDNIKLTEKGGVAYKSTLSDVYDMFALGGAYRSRTNADVALQFKKAYMENPTLALKCLFYLRDCRQGQGERRYFRVAYNWLCKNDSNKAGCLAPYVSEYGRWDDLIYATYDTPVWDITVAILESQLKLDMECKTPSLLGKWMPSENASSIVTKTAATKIRKSLGLTSREYRKMLSLLRKKINIIERLMSENRWDEIEFDKIPSKAGLIYRNAFARRDLIAQKYKEFAMSEKTTVNAKTLYPYEVVNKALCNGEYGYRYGYYNHFKDMSNVERAMINKYWENLPDYFNGSDNNMLCVVDTSGSMECSYNHSVRPIDVAISLGIYAGERAGGPFKNHFVTFSTDPKLMTIKGVDFVDKVRRIYDNCIVESTNLTKVFDLFYDMVVSGRAKVEDLPNSIVIISDMEIDSGCRNRFSGYGSYSAVSEMEQVRAKWDTAGIPMPHLVYWNVEARNDTILDLSADVSYVSGFSPTVFKQVITGKTGIDLMLETLLSERYSVIK